MRITLLLPVVLLAGAGTAPASAQVKISREGGPPLLRLFQTEDPKRAVIGLTTSTGSARDTLGLLVSSVTANSPAEKAGIGEGDRLVSINGVNLKLASADVGDPDMTDVLGRRLLRELGKLKPGDEVDLKVYSGGQTKSLKIKTLSAADVYGEQKSVAWKTRGDTDDRASLGVTFGNTGSKRDTLGVLIMGVDDDGPAAKAGIEEGNRIATINGANLRVSREDADDEYIASSRVGRLQRELEKVKPGDEVSLQVYAGGQFKSVKLKAAKASDLKSQRHGFMFNGVGGGGFLRVLPPDDMNFDRAEMRQTLERAMEGARVNLQSLRGSNLDRDELRQTIDRAMEGARFNIESLRGLKGLRGLDELRGLDTLRERLRDLKVDVPRLRIRMNDDDPPDPLSKMRTPLAPEKRVIIRGASNSA